MISACKGTLEATSLGLRWLQVSIAHEMLAEDKGYRLNAIPRLELEPRTVEQEAEVPVSFPELGGHCCMNSSKLPRVCPGVHDL